MRGATLKAYYLGQHIILFQSTLLMRGATEQPGECRRVQLISIHAPHARSDNPVYPFKQQQLTISIHAPHARSDVMTGGPGAYWVGISIHAPHARSDLDVRDFRGGASQFQSTLLMRGATSRKWGRYPSRSHFNPRSSCEERQDISVYCRYRFDFNPRSSCEERPSSFHPCVMTAAFQSTLLMRGAT